MSTGWNKNQIGWKFDDLFEGGFRFDNQTLNRWCVISKDFANNEIEAHEFLTNNVDTLELHPYN